MTAQEFYKENKGKYFMYRECRVRVVGFDIDDNNSLPIMIAHKDGYWSFPYSIYKDVDYVVDESLINDGDMGEWVSIESLIPIEEELNLCELLKGCEGFKIYSLIHGDVVLKSIIDRCNDPIVVTLSDGDTIDYCKDGRYLSMYDGECTLFPSKENRDWSTFVHQNKIKVGTPVMCKKDGIHGWSLRRYDGIISRNYNYIVPVSEFNFDDFDANKVWKYKQS